MEYTIKIDGKKIEPWTHVKYLGILIDSFLNWNFHIDELYTKLSCAVGMLAKIRHYINEKTLSMVWGQSNHQSQKWKNYKIKH